MMHGCRNWSIALGLGVALAAIGCQNSSKLPPATLPTTSKGLPAPSSSTSRPHLPPIPRSPAVPSTDPGPSAGLGQQPFNPVGQPSNVSNPASFRPQTTPISTPSTIVEPGSQIALPGGTNVPGLLSDRPKPGLKDFIPPNPPSSSSVIPVSGTVAPPTPITTPTPSLPGYGSPAAPSPILEPPPVLPK